MYNHTITLNNGVKIPQLGLGTWFIDDSKVADAEKAADSRFTEENYKMKNPYIICHMMISIDRGTGDGRTRRIYSKEQ